MRRDKIVQPADVQHRDIKIKRWLNIGRIKGAEFGRVLIYPHLHIESLFNNCNRPTNVQQHAIGSCALDSQAVCLREIDRSLIIVFGRTKRLRELLRRHIAMIIGARRVVERLKQSGETFPIAQRQSDCQFQMIVIRQALNRLQPRQGPGQVITENLFFSRAGGERERNDKGKKESF